MLVVLVVLGLVLGTAVLTVGLFGFARSIGFITHVGAASEALNEVGQIAPDVRVTAAGTSASPGANTPGEAVATPPTAAAVAGAPPAAAPPATGGVPNATAAPDVSESVAGSLGGGGNAAGTGGAFGGGAGGMAGAGGAGGASPSVWDGVLQSFLTLLGQSTVSMCGPNTCNVGQVCCNASCGTCVAPGGTCDQTLCAGAARPPTAVRCGSGQCNDGQVCCNASCGLCAAPGETCATLTCP